MSRLFDNSDLDGRKILVIDDEPTLLLGIQYALITEGASVDIASSAKVGLSLAVQTNYDLIVLDFQMPQIDGIECIQSLRESGDTSNIVLMGTQLTAENIVRCAGCGVMNFLEKPITPKRLRSVVVHALGAGGSIFEKMIEAALDKDWDAARSYLSDLDQPKLHVWEAFFKLGCGKIEPGKGGVFPLGSFEP